MRFLHFSLACFCTERVLAANVERLIEENGVRILLDSLRNHINNESIVENGLAVFMEVASTGYFVSVFLY